uniref:Uncharacterized protein n=1 Tax=Tetraselmis sp. GSL018 TaxID=582737 RepID=A0A061SAJ0_9CHLO|mmetsp:Transcript_35211/g.83521  ORF Transcript_35211/g.83521 Transcript_35211/m.83521 type:complete len:318 (-) Transcript_35211:1243-2196(-)
MLFRTKLRVWSNGLHNFKANSIGIAFIIMVAALYFFGSWKHFEMLGRPITAKNVPAALDVGGQHVSGDGVLVLDSSLDSIFFGLKIWDTLLQKDFPWYISGQHGILQAKYQGYKAKLFYSEMIATRLKGFHLKNLCELGMYAGSSSLFLLLSNSKSHLYSFDSLSKSKDLGKTAAKYLVSFGRTSVIFGSSLTTVPKFSEKHPRTICDLVLIDGCKEYSVRLQDIKNFRAISHRNTIVFLDEVCSVECVKGGHYKACLESRASRNTMSACLAYRKAVQLGILEIKTCLNSTGVPENYPTGDYVCSAQYVFDKPITER